MEKIASFTINHETLLPGLYISRIDGDITTYDLRTRRPNTDDLMDHSTMHTCEHMFATYIRNSYLKEDIVYFGPMGCQTGFYLLVRNADHHKVLDVLKTACQQVLDHDGEVFGKSSIECGNYKTLDLEKSKQECARYLEVLKTVDADNLNY